MLSAASPLSGTTFIISYYFCAISLKMEISLRKPVSTTETIVLFLASSFMAAPVISSGVSIANGVTRESWNAPLRYHSENRKHSPSYYSDESCRRRTPNTRFPTTHSSPAALPTFPNWSSASSARDTTYLGYLSAGTAAQSSPSLPCDKKESSDQSWSKSNPGKP